MATMTKRRKSPLASAESALRCLMVALNAAMACLVLGRILGRSSSSPFHVSKRPPPMEVATSLDHLLTHDGLGGSEIGGSKIQWLPSDFTQMLAQAGSSSSLSAAATTLPLTNGGMSVSLTNPPPVAAAVAVDVAGAGPALAGATPNAPAPASTTATPVTTPSGCVVASNDPPALRVIVMTGGTRVASLNRLLKSLVDADAMGDRIDLDVWIDVPNSDRASSEYLQREALATDIRTMKSNGTYTHGRVRAFVWGSPSGLRKQWLETWDRSTPCGLGEWTSEVGLILEDDLELSPYFWRWLKGAHAAYGKDPRVAGFTLQRASLCAKMCPDLLGGPSNSSAAFFYPLVGSWGYSPTVAHWIRFRRWYYDFIKTTEKPYVEGLKPTEWYKSFEKAGTAGKRMWTMHHIKYVDTHEDKYTVYVKCPNNATLSQNHLEPGINYATKRPSDHARMTVWDEALLKFPKQPLELDWAGQAIGGQGDAGGFL